MVDMVERIGSALMANGMMDSSGIYLRRDGVSEKDKNIISVKNISGGTIEANRFAKINSWDLTNNRYEIDYCSVTEEGLALIPRGQLCVTKKQLTDDSYGEAYIGGLITVELIASAGGDEDVQVRDWVSGITSDGYAVKGEAFLVVNTYTSGGNYYVQVI